MIVKECHFDKELTNRRVVWWLCIIGANVGDDVLLAEYLVWVNEQASTFKQLENIADDTPLAQLEDGQRNFDLFLQKQLPTDAGYRGVV